MLVNVGFVSFFVDYDVLLLLDVTVLLLGFFVDYYLWLLLCNVILLLHIVSAMLEIDLRILLFSTSISDYVLSFFELYLLCVPLLLLLLLMLLFTNIFSLNNIGFFYNIIWVFFRWLNICSYLFFCYPIIPTILSFS